MDNKKTLKTALKKQNDFILEFFNDDRIPDSIKEEYMEQYNKLYVKILEDIR